MGWLLRFADSDAERIKRNILRLESLKRTVHDLGYYAFASQSGGLVTLQSLLDDKLVRGRELVWKKLNEADVGENHQKIVLDSPSKFQQIMVEAEALIDREIVKERKNLRELNDERVPGKSTTTIREKGKRE